MNTREAAEATLRAIGAQVGDDIDLAEGALALAALDRPRVPLERYRAHLTELRADVAAERANADGGAQVAALNRTLFDRHGYEGDTQTYDDLQNANLMRVIDRKKGLPVALSILYIAAGRAQGWRIEGVNFPGHFLVRVLDGRGGTIVDPFRGGRTHGAGELRELLRAVAGADAELRPEHHAALGNRDILLRLQNNVKLRLLQSGSVEGALRALDAMRLFAPDRGELWRETGLLQARLGNLRAAADTLERHLLLARGDGERHQAAALLQSVRSRLN